MYMPDIASRLANALRKITRQKKFTSLVNIATYLMKIGFYYLYFCITAIGHYVQINIIQLMNFSLMRVELLFKG